MPIQRTLNFQQLPNTNYANYNHVNGILLQNYAQLDNVHVV